MKKGHIVLWFLLVVFCCFINIFLEQQNYQKAEREKERMEESLLYAVKTAAWELTEVMEESDEVQLYTFQESFFRAWFVRLGYASAPEAQESLRLHLPLMAVLTEDGGYFFCTETKQKDGVLTLEQRWHERIPYQLTGDNEADRKYLKGFYEENVSRIITNHNYIAEQYGIGYEFSSPYFLVDEKKKLTFPMILVVFQGWPLGISGNYCYENCIDAGAYIKK